MELSPRYRTLLLACLVVILQNHACSGERFMIIHWNDIGAQVERFYPGTEGTSKPPTTPCENDKCVGGLSNLVYYINEAYESEPSIKEENKIKLTPGNLASGENGWLSIIGWSQYGNLINDFYNPTAMSLGVKDFGAGLERTIDYLNASFVKPVLTNVDCSTTIPNSPEARFCPFIIKMQELAPSVGLLGFTNPNVMRLGSPGSLNFEDVVSALSKEVNKYPDFKTFVAIGDGSLDTSKRILEAIPKIKLVIYGMGFGTSKNMQGNYPMQHGNGYIATAGSYGSTIGKLVFDTDSNGNIAIVKASSKLIPTVGLMADVEASKRVVEFAQSVQSYTNPIGQAIFKIEGGERCWRNECNLGNLVTDAMVHCAYNNSTINLNEKTPVLSLWHGGALFDDEVKPSQHISHLDIHKWLPYHNRAHLVKIQGSKLWEVFQASGKGIHAKSDPVVPDWGQFLQVSNGMEVYYSEDGTLQRIRILHEEDSTPLMKDLEPALFYYFVIPSIISEGRTVYGFAKDYWQLIHNIGFDDDCLKGYVQALGKITVGFEERIWIGSSDLPCDGPSIIRKGSNTGVTVIVTIIIMLILIGVAFVGYFYVIPRLTGRKPNGFRNFSDA